MKGQLQKRPESKRITMRPLANKVSEANQKQSQQCFQMGKKHMANKQYPQALRHYFTATMHNPQNYKAFCNMGTILKQLGNYKEAKKTYQRALLAKPDDHISLYNFGNLNRISGDQDTAIPLYQKVIKLKQQLKMDIGTLYGNSIINQGICYQNIGKYDQAIQCYTKYTQVCPDSEEGYFNKGMCLIKKIKKLNKQKYSKVQKLLCSQAKKVLEVAKQKNDKNYITKVASIEIKFLQNPIIQQYQNANDELSKLAQQINRNPANCNIDQDYVKTKQNYCLMQIKRLQNTRPVSSLKTENVYDQKHKVDQQKVFQRNIQSQKSVRKDNVADARPPTGSKVSRPKTGTKLSRPLTGSKLVRPESSSNKNKQFQNLLQQGKFGEALDLVNIQADSKQKFEKQILVNLLNAQESDEEKYFHTAKFIYDNKIGDKEITKQSCTKEGHEICASLFLQMNEYDLATKHYEMLMEILEQNNKKQGSEEQGMKNNEQLQRIRTDLGVLYAEKGQYSEAIKQFKKNLQKNPNNYTLITSLGLCYIQNNQKDKALKLYQQYLEKQYPQFKNNDQIHIQSEEKKIYYIDCLINIAICFQEQSDEEQKLKKAKRQIQRFYPTYKSQKQNFTDTSNLLGVYLRLTEIYENKLQGKSYSQVKQLNQQLLDYYLGCLQYPQCPDRGQILINCGILFYLSGCYANAYMIYSKVSSRDVSNDLGLTLLHLDEYEKSLQYLQQAVDKQPDNIVYMINYDIVKWICGLFNDCLKSKLIEKYPCKCSHMVNGRLSYGIGLIDYLTEKINQIDLQINQKNSKNDKAISIINGLITEYEKLSENKKACFIRQYMDQHMKTFPVHEQKYQLKKFSSKIGDILTYFTTYPSQFEERLRIILDFFKSLPPNPYYTTYFHLYAYVVLCTRTLKCNALNINRTARNIIPHSHATEKIPKRPTQQYTYQQRQDNQELWHLPEFPQYHRYQVNDKQQYYFNEIFLEGSDSKSINNFMYQTQLYFPQGQLKIQNFTPWLRDIEASIQNQSQMMVEYIEKAYYESQGIEQPFRKQTKYPRHREQMTDCSTCKLKLIRTFATFFNKYMFEDQPKLNWQNNYKDVQKKLKEDLSKFSQQILSSKGKLDKKTLKYQLQITPYRVPFTLITHHRTMEQARQFIKRICPDFQLTLHQGDIPSKGVRKFYVNKRFTLHCWWGQMCHNFTNKTKEQLSQCLTYFDMLIASWQNLVTQPFLQSLIMLEEMVDLNEFPQKLQWLEQDHKYIPDGIKLMRYLIEDGDKYYKTVKTRHFGLMTQQDLQEWKKKQQLRKQKNAEQLQKKFQRK